MPLAGALAASLFAWSAGPARALPPPVDGGPLPEIVRQAWRDGRLRPAAHAAGAVDAPLAASGHVVDEPRDAAGATRALPLAATGRWQVPVLLVDFPDRRATHAAGAFRSLLFDTTGAVPTGSLADYFREVSGGQLLVRGDVHGWRTMPDTANFYANDSYGLATTTFPQNAAGLLYAAVKEFDADVDFSRYDRNGDGFVDALLLLHSGLGAEAAASDRTQFWSVTSGLLGNWGFTGSYVTKDPRPGFPGQFMKIDQFSILAEWSPVNPPQVSEIGVWCHEFGHDLGWPDLYDASTLGGGVNLGAGNWCLMATGGYGGDSRSPARPTHPCAWAKLDAGWATEENLAVDGDRTFLPIATSRRAYRLWYQGEDNDEFFLLENRQRLGFDADLPGEGLIVTRIRRDVIAQRRAANNINSGLVPGFRLEEADGRYDLMRSGNRGDARDPFPGSQNRLRFADDTVPSTRTLDGRPLNTSLEALRAKGDDVSGYVQLSPAGWSAPIAVGTVGPSGALVSNGRSALLSDPAGDQWLAYEDDTPTGTEVFLRRKRFGIDWGVPIRFTNEPGLSLSPTIVQNRTGRKAIAWWDTRDGNSEIYYAWSPPDGSFGAPIRVTHQVASSQLPAAAWLSDGRLALAWMDGRAEGNCIFTRILTPGFENASSDVQASFAEPLVEVGNAAVPTIATAGNRVIVAYQERIGGVDEVKACVDSAGRFSTTRFLSERDGFTSNQPVLVSDTDTSVWLFWRENGPQTNEIRQARWSVSIGWDLGYDVYRSTLTLDLPRPALDSNGDLHLLFRRATTNGLELVEAKFHRAGRVWDAGPSRLVSFGTEQATGTAFAYDSFGRAHVVWLGVTPSERRLRELVRAAPASSPVAVDPGPGGDGAAGLALVAAWPNPARGRAVLRVAGAAPRPAGARAHLYSVAGRKLATLDAAGADALAWDGLDGAGRAAAPGIVLVRVVDANEKTLAAGRFVWLP